ncbi:MAG TPA: helix-turn-helix transcriptional regulator [Candidatus Saccharimonadales bacterium]|jgi:transcriptional regulator with XRE-family HTH domain|nr:helix-turn-helix transcriptional regulator [Candidatus Saccharimonadales bacterium]
MSRDIVVRFGRRIRQIRTAKGINQTILAEKIGTDQSTISLVENGKQEPGLKFIELLAMGLKMPLAELFRDL